MKLKPNPNLIEKFEFKLSQMVAELEPCDLALALAQLWDTTKIS